MQTTYHRKLVCIVIVVVLCAMNTSVFAQTSGISVAVVVSQKIRPYLQVVDGILDEIPSTLSSPEVFFLSSEDGKGLSQVSDRLTSRNYALVAAVGPEAASLVWKAGIKSKKIYTAVLDPSAVPHLPNDACGVSLRVPVFIQVKTIAEKFPFFKKSACFMIRITISGFLKQLSKHLLFRITFQKSSLLK